MSNKENKDKNTVVKKTVRSGITFGTYVIVIAKP